MMKFLTTLALAMIAFAASAAGPRPVFLPADTVDLGSISGKELASGIVRVVNAGDEPLMLQYVYTDCTCTTARYSKAPVAPGDTTEITVNFDGRDRLPGRFFKVLRFRTNAEPQIKPLFVTGHIARPYRK